MIVRKAGPADASGIARVHVESWRTTYQGIVPDSVLDNLSVEKRENRWKQDLRQGKSRTFVAETSGGEIVGFACSRPERTKAYGYDGELYAIYLLQRCQRKGIGRRLFRAAAQELAADGFRSFLVWVLADNPSRRFYEALGGEKTAEEPVTIGEVTLQKIAYGWKDIGALVDPE
ncbi:MAG: GNAT family N-acetyltransferase [Planifilum fimeticola]